MNEPYAKFIGTITLPEEYRLGLLPPAEKEFPWNWLIIGGLIFVFIITAVSKQSGRP